MMDGRHLHLLSLKLSGLEQFVIGFGQFGLLLTLNLLEKFDFIFGLEGKQMIRNHHRGNPIMIQQDSQTLHIRVSFFQFTANYFIKHRNMNVSD